MLHFSLQFADHVTDATSKGAEAIVGGARNDDLGPCYYCPSLLVGASTEMRLAHEETFGSIAPVIK
jgi:succinate-semialdehyde dehydrogenase/glutarate-semialdehyde dehydrogenase